MRWLMAQLLKGRCKTIALHAALWPLLPGEGYMLSLE